MRLTRAFTSRRDPQQPESRENDAKNSLHPGRGAFAVLGYSLFALQQPAPLTLRTLEQALTAPRTRRDEEFRGSLPRVDAFALLGEIGFLDI